MRAMNIPTWLRDAGSHERPWWLKTHEEAGRWPEGRGHRYELPFPDFDASGDVVAKGHTSPVVAASTSTRSRSSRAGAGENGDSSGRRRARQVVVPSGGPPATPTTHMRNLLSSVQRPLPVTGNDEYHRAYYFPDSSLSAPPGKLIKEEASRGPEAKEGLGNRKKVFGSLDSEYAQACREVEKGWKEDRVKRAASEPGFGYRPNVVNPSLLSPGVTKRFIGGTHMALKHTVPASIRREETRQIGLYEDSFPMWQKAYQPPEHGLGQTDVTQFAGMAALQKVLMRK